MEIKFNINEDKGLHIFVGKMGTGKSNLLNAINWCLYGDEPIIEGKDQLINKSDMSTDEQPRLNTEKYKCLKPGNTEIVSVKIYIVDGNSTIIFQREEKYRLVNEKTVNVSEDNFEVTIIEPDTQPQIFEEYTANAYVEKFVPQEIRDYFFFDGEKLDRYFKETSGHMNKHAIETISQIEILEKSKETLDDIFSEYRRLTTKNIPELKKITEDLEAVEDKIKKLEEEKVLLDSQKGTAKDTESHYDRLLRGVPDVKKLSEEQSRKEEKKGKLKEKRNEKEKVYKDLLRKYSVLIPIDPAIQFVLDYISSNQSIGKFPPTNDERLIEEIIHKKECICGRTVDSEEIKILEKLKEKISLPAKIVAEILEESGKLKNLKKEIVNFPDVMKRNYEDIDGLDSEIDSIQNEIDEIGRKIKGYDQEQIGKYYENRGLARETIDRNNNRLGQISSELDKLKRESKDLTEKLNKGKNLIEDTSTIESKKDFVNNSREILEKIKDNVIVKIKNEVEEKTKDIFLKLSWKKQTFNGVKLDDNYKLYLIHEDGFKISKTSSGGEGEILALSFVSALHEVSGFNSTVVIDRPITLVSGEATLKVAEVLTKMSSNKQLILMFNTDEYPLVSTVLDNACSDKFLVGLTSSERECYIQKVI